MPPKSSPLVKRLEASSGALLRLEGRLDIKEHLPNPGADISTSSGEIVRSDSKREYETFVMASRGRRGVPAREGEQRRDEPRREDQGEQQAPAPQGPVLLPPPPVDYGVFIQGLVQAMQTQAHTQAALQAQLEAQQAQERADVWWSSILRTRFEDGAVEIAWDELVAFEHRTLEQALSVACRQEGEMEQYLEEKNVTF
ncbi:hypothetical protein Taro_054874 [Colocasia esculenta]|uniref:Uncharacterized protein n=1 Tax=Colocasia esculenta TaxID=4460 RepID=A0A843XRY7_COLES|nr:hypothetical protein [Colocasia esculenta]